MRVEGLDSESVLLASNVLLNEQLSSAFQQRSDLELLAVLQRISWELNTSGVDGPSLIQTVMAVVEDSVSPMSVALSSNIKALVGNVSQVSEVSTEVG